MNEKKRRKNTVIPIIVGIVGLVFVAALFYSPFYQINRKNSNFEPFVNSEKLEKISTTYMSDDSFKHIYRDTLGSGYRYEIVTPSRNQSLITGYVEITANNLTLLIHPERKNRRYDVGITSYGHKRVSAVDKDGQPLSRHPDDSKEFYQKWLALYEQHYDEIMEMFETVREVFGDALQ